MIAHIKTENWLANGAKTGLWEIRCADAIIPDINIRFCYSKGELISMERGKTEVCKSIDVPYFHVLGKPEKGNEIGKYELVMLLGIAEKIRQQLRFGKASREEVDIIEYDIEVI